MPVDPLGELEALLTGGSRVIMVSTHDVDLRPTGPDVTLFLLKIAEGSLAAGGRGGGFGERKVLQVSCFRRSGGILSKDFDTEEVSKVEEFEVPYYVSRIPFTLSSGADSMGYGVVDPELVAGFRVKAGLSPA